jgi:glutathione S-transferase
MSIPVSVVTPECISLRNFEPDVGKRAFGAEQALEVFESRRALVTRQLARSPYLAGDTFTAADISVTYALEFAQRTGVAALGDAERAYIARTTGRAAYERAMEACHATREWAANARR